LGLLAKLGKLLIQVDQIGSNVVALLLEKYDVVLLLKFEDFLVQIGNGFFQFRQLLRHRIHGPLGGFAPHLPLELQKFAHAGVGKELGILGVGTGDPEDKNRRFWLLLHGQIGAESLEFRMGGFDRAGGSPLDLLALHQGNLGAEVIGELFGIDRAFFGQDPGCHHHPTAADVEGLAQEIPNPLHQEGGG